MSWDLRYDQRVRFFTGSLTEYEITTVEMKRDAATQIRQRKIGRAVAAVGRTQQRKQSLVLIDGQKLAVAERPPLWREILRNDFYFG